MRFRLTGLLLHDLSDMIIIFEYLKNGFLNYRLGTFGVHEQLRRRSPLVNDTQGMGFELGLLNVAKPNALIS